MKSLLPVLFFWVFIFSSCKKNNGGDVRSTKQLNDSSLQIAREVYLWYNQIPGNFNGDQLADPSEVMQGIRPYSREAGFNNAVDKWSFGISRKEWENISNGISADLGLGIFFNDATDLRVSYVEPNSVAGKAGIQRSWQITAINGNTTINTTDAGIDMIVSAIYGSSPATIRFKKPDGAVSDISLTPGTYNETPILLDTVYTIGGKNIGYFVLNSFLGDVVAIKAGFQQLFNSFQSRQVKELVVDLRYNGGGYVELEKELANYLVPTASDKTVMSKMFYNDKMAAKYNTSSDFAKLGSTELTKIVFIISKNTASASEAIINIMKPHVNVKLVGPGKSTGKAVGFSGYYAGDWIVFPVSFRQMNSNNEGNYFSGLIPDKEVRDGLDKAWGNTNEDCLASALKYLTTGNFRISQDEPFMDPSRLNYYNKLKIPKLNLFIDSKEPRVFQK